MQQQILSDHKKTDLSDDLLGSEPELAKQTQDMRNRSGSRGENTKAG